MKLRVNEIFYSIQGEGIRAGTANVFVRFAGCNLTCNREEHGFDCDTEFVSGVDYEDEGHLMAAIYDAAGPCRSIIWTGGEPALQLNRDMVKLAAVEGFFQAIETNGTRELPKGINWITCSPKTAEHTIRLEAADEVKYVRAAGQGIPKPRVKAPYKLLSPAFDGLDVDPAALAWCLKLVRENPDWRLSVQMHKAWRVR